MMKNNFDYLPELSGNPEEREWIRERLETLSVREGYVLAAATARHPPKNTREAVDCIHSLDDYEVCFPVGSYAELGTLHTHQTHYIPEDALPYTDLERLGKMYEDEHPGLFVGQCYVIYPKQPAAPSSHEEKLPPLRDDGWIIKLKLASPAVPEGVWLRLPCFDGEMPGESVEVELVLHELKASSLEDCTLLEARCVLPEICDLVKQYDSITKLVEDCAYLSYVIDKHSQGNAHWMEKFAAALEYEDCHTLRSVLDISENLDRYEWISRESLADFAANRLRKRYVSDETIRSGCIDLERCARSLLETSGYMLTKDGSAYVTRGGQEFIHESAAAEHREETVQQEQCGISMQ